MGSTSIGQLHTSETYSLDDIYNNAEFAYSEKVSEDEKFILPPSEWISSPEGAIALREHKTAEIYINQRDNYFTNSYPVYLAYLLHCSHNNIQKFRKKLIQELESFNLFEG